MWKKGLLLILVTNLVGIFLTFPAFGKEYPTKPIEVVIPFSAGSSTEINIRLFANTSKKYLGQPLVLICKPGAAAALGAADVVSSKPDGYKILATTHSFFFTTALTQKIPFDPNDLVPLVNIAQFRDGIVVRGDSPWKTLNDLLDYARKNPGKLKWAHSGRGHNTHLFGLIMFKKSGVETIDVPYPGSPEKMAALLGGHIDAATNPLGSIKDLVEARKVKYLVMQSDRRYKDLPDVPSAAELGFPEVVKVTPWITFFVHKNTPEVANKTLFEAFKRTFEDPEFVKQFEKIGEEPKFMGPEALKEALQKSKETVIPILKELGLYIGK